jgi:hypothetical protein
MELSDAERQEVYSLYYRYRRELEEAQERYDLAHVARGLDSVDQGAWSASDSLGGGAAVVRQALRRLYKELTRTAERQP